MALLRRNYIGMHATVMYRRSVLESIGSFDTSLRACEDYELYLRIARTAPVYCHDRITAEYRIHNGNMSSDLALMLKYSMRVLRSQRKYLVHQSQTEALRSGARFWRTLFGDRLIPTCKSTFHGGSGNRQSEACGSCCSIIPEVLLTSLCCYRVEFSRGSWVLLGLMAEAQLE